MQGFLRVSRVLEALVVGVDMTYVCLVVVLAVSLGTCSRYHLHIVDATRLNCGRDVVLSVPLLASSFLRSQN